MIEDDSAKLLALFTGADFPFSTIAVDAVYTIAGDATGDAFYGGVGALQRIGQQAVGRRLIVRLDGYAAAQQGRDEAVGGRLETLVNSSRATSGISSWPVLELE